MKLLFSLLGLGYVLCPYDLIPDFFLGPGWLDDLIVIGLLWWYFYSSGKRLFRSGTYYRRNGKSSTGENRKRASGEKFAGSGPKSSQQTTLKDPYAVLGIRKNASSKEIKSAYRLLATQYHPDKVGHLGEEFRELAEIRFKEIQGAYHELIK